MSIETDFSLEQLLEAYDLNAIVAAASSLSQRPIRVLSVSGAILAASGEFAASCACSSHLENPGVPPPPTTVRQCVARGDPCRVVQLEQSGRRIGWLVVASVERPLVVDASWSERVAELLGLMLHQLMDGAQRVRLTNGAHTQLMQENFLTLSRKHAELLDLTERSSEFDRLKSNLLAAASHELRTPLSAILGLSELLADAALSPSLDHLELVSRIQGQASHLLRVVDDLLFLSEAESGALVVAKRALEPKELIQRLAAYVRSHSGAHRLHFELVEADQYPPILGDSAHLERALQRLLDNAMKFTPADGRVTLSVTTIALPPLPAEERSVLLPNASTWLEFRVADTGRGVSRDERQRVFAPFHQGNMSADRSHGGLGLGLSLTRRIIDAHQGTISVEDGPAGGAMFVVRLPVG